MRRGFFEDPACCALSSGTRKTRKISKYKAQTEIWRPRSPALKDAGKWLDRYPDLGRQEQAALMRQFGHPTGVLGRLAGLVMAVRRSNRERNRWTVDQLDVQPTDEVLEIGYGPGIGIAHAARRAVRGSVVGVDVSEVMRRQAARRNRAGIATGQVVLHVGTIDSPALDGHRFSKAAAVNVVMFWPDPVAVRKWWEGHQGGFSSGTRYLVGQPIGPESLGRVLREGYQRQRAAAALELAIMTPGKPLFEVRAPGFRQQRLLGGAGG